MNAWWLVNSCFLLIFCNSPLFLPFLAWFWCKKRNTVRNAIPKCWFTLKCWFSTLWKLHFNRNIIVLHGDSILSPLAPWVDLLMNKPTRPRRPPPFLNLNQVKTCKKMEVSKKHTSTCKQVAQHQLADRNIQHVLFEIW